MTMLLRSLIPLAVLFAGDAVLAADNELLGDWDITAIGLGIGRTPSHVDLMFEEVDGEIVAYIYDTPVPLRMDGDSFEVDLDWSTGFATSHVSTLIGSVTDDGSLSGTVSHNGDTNFLGDPMRDGTFSGERAQPHTVDMEASPDPVDLSGVWRRAFGRWKVRKNSYAMTPEGQAIIDTYDEMDNPTIRCASPGLVMATDLPYPLQIINADDHIVLIYGADYVRRIYLDGREFPKESTASSLGFSTGEWKGDTLVVTTTQLTPAFISHTGQPVSGDAFTIEHLYLDDSGYLHADMWIHDPENYTRPPYIPKVMDLDFNPIVLTKIGCDPYSYFRQLYLDGKLEEFWGRAKTRR